MDKAEKFYRETYPDVGKLSLLDIEIIELLKKHETEIYKNSVLANVSGIPNKDLEHLISWNLSENHTKRWGVIKGKCSCTYSFMHKNKNKVLEWLKTNYR